MTSLACVSLMAVPDALCIIFSCPAVTVLLSALLLGHPLGPVNIASCATLLSGVVLVCQPSFIFQLEEAKWEITKVYRNLMRCHLKLLTFKHSNKASGPHP